MKFSPRTAPVAILFAALFGSLPARSADVDIPPTVVLGGGTNSDNYTLTANGQVQGNGTFSGTFQTGVHSLTIDSLTGNMVFDGAIAGSATSPLPNLTIVAGTHTVALNGTNTFSGDVILETGTLKLGNASALGSAAGSLRTTLGAVTVDLNGQSISAEQAGISAATIFRNSSATTASWGGAISIDSAVLTFDAAAGDLSVAGAITSGGLGGAIKTGAQVLTVSGNNSGLGAAWNLQEGTLKFGHSDAVGNAGVLVTSNGTTVDLNGQSMVARTIQLSATSVTIANSAAAGAIWSGNVSTTLANTNVILNAAGGNLTITGAIAQGASNTSVTVQGANTTTLASGSNSYTGSTTVSVGSTLVLADNSLLEFAIGATSGVNNQITGGGNITLDGDIAFNLLGAGTTLGDAWTIVNVSTLAETWGTNFLVLGFTHQGGGVWHRNQSGTLYQFTQANGELSVIPEPGSVALALAGGAALFALRRIRRRTK